MTVFAAIAFAAFFLEDNHFVAFYERSENFANHFGTFYGGGADFHLSVGISEENTVEFYGFSFFNGFAEIMNIQELVLFSFELLSLDFYDCVHLFK